MKETLRSAEEMKKYATSFVAGLAPQGNVATIIGLSGDLGAGKTTFSQGAAAALGIADMVQSPTFVIMKMYDISTSDSFKKLVHIDAYRLEKSSELLHLGFERLVADPGNLVLIEWPERVEDILPEHTTLYFDHVSENERTVSTEK